MAGVLLSIVGGIVIAIQGVMNARVNEKVGIWLTTTYVHATGFVLSLLLYLLLKGGSPGQLANIQKGYMMGGLLGVAIIFTVTQSIAKLGPSYSVAIVLVSQLLFAFLIDSLGLLGTPKIPLEWNRIAGLAIMIAGIIVFKFK
ncbi:DMT family transporter [Cohnella caldifontis]|uniref:DMT family transporter n=1 Tax=Cohnella caldifontis TaxID=3027471 RepID=UPI0023ECBBCD|nr:DMT family transporter [Cohnella sp. YIM B05605]